MERGKFYVWSSGLESWEVIHSYTDTEQLKFLHSKTVGTVSLRVYRDQLNRFIGITQ